jgi:hypothetical protein
LHVVVGDEDADGPRERDGTCEGCRVYVGDDNGGFDVGLTVDETLQIDTSQ